MRTWAAVLLVLLTGCAVWHPIGGPYRGAGYTLDLPKGWMAITKDPKSILVSKDGPALQQVRVFTRDLAEQSEEVKKRITKGMLPQEVAESLLDRMRSDKSMAQFTVVENEPALLGGKEGFRLVFTYKSDKVRYRCIYYGLLDGETFYRVSYAAPVRYYFDKDAAAFEEIVKSFKVAEEKSGAAAAGK
jgi:hypothetical protein